MIKDESKSTKNKQKKYLNIQHNNEVIKFVKRECVVYKMSIKSLKIICYADDAALIIDERFKTQISVYLYNIIISTELTRN